MNFACVRAATDEELRLEIAKLDGIEFEIAQPIPDYVRDLNAVHRIEKTIPQELDLLFLKLLVDCCDADDPWTPVERATARQRCEALVLLSSSPDSAKWCRGIEQQTSKRL